MTGDLAQFNQKQGPWVWKDTYIFIQDCNKKVMAASLTLAMTSWAVALCCPTATAHRATLSERHRHTAENLADLHAESPL
jgi:hypothetical protein